MNITRKYKLSKLTGVNYLSDTEKEIIDFVNFKLSNLSEFIHPEIQGSFFYMDMERRQIIIERLSSNSYLFINSRNIWKILYENYNISESDIQKIVQYIIRNKYGITIESYKIKHKNFITDMKTFYEHNTEI